MAKTILKLTETSSVVKIVGTGTTTINLATDLLSSTQIISGTPNVAINYIQWTSAGACTITRNGATLYELPGSGSIDLSGSTGASDSVNGTYDIAVNLASTGTVVINLRKLSGYASKIEPYKFGPYDNETLVGS